MLEHKIIHLEYNYHHQSVLPKGRSFTASGETYAAVLPKEGLPPQTQEPRLLSAPHSLFSIWTDLKRSEKIQGAPTWRWGEWIWLTWPSRLHRNSPHGLNVSSIRIFDQIRDPEIPTPLLPYNLIIIINYYSISFNFRCWQHRREWTEAKPCEGKNASRVVGSAFPYFLLIGTNIVHHQ